MSLPSYSSSLDHVMLHPCPYHHQHWRQTILNCILFFYLFLLFLLLFLLVISNTVDDDERCVFVSILQGMMMRKRPESILVLGPFISFSHLLVLLFFHHAVPDERHLCTFNFFHSFLRTCSFE